MRFIAVALACLTIIFAAKSNAESLFDGKTLSGWEGDETYFHIHDGAIVAGDLRHPIPANEFLCTTQSFADFELTLDVKLVGGGDNAGVQIRSQRVPDSREMIGYQADVGTAWNKPVWGGLYDESRRREMLAWPDPEKTAAAVRSGDWNSMKIRCVGPRIQIEINGVQTIDYTETDDSIPLTGLIGLQIHSGPPSQAWYRNLTLVRLDANGNPR